MRKPKVGKPRPAVRAFSLSSRLPRLQAPLSAVRTAVSRPHPVVGRPAQSVESQPPRGAADPNACRRCGHGSAEHPIRYVCDKYPHPDPLQICGCEVEHAEEPCGRCGHRARSHKARRRCKTRDCHCWGFDGPREAAGARPC
jgi:hypothetical protein